VTTASAPGWRATVVVPLTVAPAFEDALADGDAALSSFALPQTPLWRIEAYFADTPQRARLLARVSAAAIACGIDAPALELAPVAERDWAGEALRALPPLQAGRFYLHGAHDRGSAPAGSLALEIEAGRAFGTGRHETTRGCLLALDLLARQQHYRRPLDLGCGSGVLALAAATLWRAPVTATDIDPWAVAVTRANARLNRLAPWLEAVRADGLQHPRLARRAPYDLVLANILARPLIELAGPIAAHLAPGGTVVLAGLLARQETWVRHAYAQRGFSLWRRLQLGDWPTLVLRRGWR